MSEEKKLKGIEKVLELLREGKIEINEKTGKPRIRDLMEKAGISRSYAFKARRIFLRKEKAKEAPLTSEVEVEEVTGEKPKVKRKVIKEPEREKEELVAEGEKALTYEEVLAELKELEEMFADMYDTAIGKDSILTTATGDSDYGRSRAICERLARNWIRVLRRRVDPETLEGYDTIALAGNHALVAGAILLVYWRKKKEAKGKTKKEAK